MHGRQEIFDFDQIFVIFELNHDKLAHSGLIYPRNEKIIALRAIILQERCIFSSIHHKLEPNWALI